MGVLTVQGLVCREVSRVGWQGSVNMVLFFRGRMQGSVSRENLIGVILQGAVGSGQLAKGSLGGFVCRNHLSGDSWQVSASRGIW